MNAATWFYSQSFHGNTEDSQPSRPEPTKIGDHCTVDRWDSENNYWREVNLVWDGENWIPASD